MDMKKCISVTEIQSDTPPALARSQLIVWLWLTLSTHCCCAVSTNGGTVFTCRSALGPLVVVHCIVVLLAR